MLREYFTFDRNKYICKSEFAGDMSRVTFTARCVKTSVNSQKDNEIYHI